MPVKGKGREAMIVSRPSTPAYRDNWDRIFEKSQKPEGLQAYKCTKCWFDSVVKFTQCPVCHSPMEPIVHKEATAND